MNGQYFLHINFGFQYHPVQNVIAFSRKVDLILYILPYMIESKNVFKPDKNSLNSVPFELKDFEEDNLFFYFRYDDMWITGSAFVMEKPLRSLEEIKELVSENKMF